MLFWTKSKRQENEQANKTMSRRKTRQTQASIKSKFHHTDKTYMHKIKLVLEDETHTILLLKTDHPIPATRQDLVLMNKKIICFIVRFAEPTDHRVKRKEGEELNKYLDRVRKNCAGDNDTSGTFNSHEEPGKKTPRTGDQKNRKHPDHDSIKQPREILEDL